MASKIDKLTAIAANEYRKRTNSETFVHVSLNQMQTHEPGVLYTIKNSNRRSGGPADIETISVPEVTPLYMGIPFKGRTKWERNSQSKTGAWWITFKDYRKEKVEPVIVIRTPYGSQRQLVEIVAGPIKSLYNISRLGTVLRKHNSKLKPGIWRPMATQEGVIYNELSRVADTPTIHPCRQEIFDSINFTRDNYQVLTRYGRPGIMKLMMIGPPGTGKSTLLTEIARTYSKDHPVLFTTDLHTAADVSNRLAANDMFGIIIIEDAESSLNKDNTNSRILNFLDGIDQPRCSKGCVLIMTTNYPEMIEARILQRPGRVDKIIKVGELEGSYALECARLYFPEDTKITDAELISAVNELTGAQIMGLAQSCIAVAVTNQRDIDAELLKEVKEKMANDLKEAYEYAKTNDPMLGRRRQPAFGFTYSNGEEELDF